MTSLEDKIASIKKAHMADIMPLEVKQDAVQQMVIKASTLMAAALIEPQVSKHRLGMTKRHFYSSRQWAAMKRRRHLAQASRRRNRR